AVIIEKSAGPKIQVGSTVVARKEDPSNQEGKTCQYNVVGQEEADISAGKISHQSPLGNALIGKKKGDSVVINAPGGKVKYKIIDLL
ncbi:MAG: GreA/GreB family elongation factor, partial [Patescibacteria group bacterium]